MQNLIFVIPVSGIFIIGVVMEVIVFVGLSTAYVYIWSEKPFIWLTRKYIFRKQN